VGHTRLGVLPASKKWNELRALIAGDATAEAISEKTLSNVIGLFGDADADRYGALAKEPGVVESMWALMTLPALARETPQFERALGSVGFELPPGAWTSPVAFVDAVADAVADRVEQSEAGTFSELGVLAFRETALRHLARTVGSLFDSDRSEIARSWSAFGTSARFGDLAQHFLASLLERSVQYYVSRAVPEYVGSDKRFNDPDDVEAFNRDVGVWCRERAGIAEAFAASWLSKETYVHGRPTRDTAARFVAYALAKVGSEVRAHRPDQ
jgi:hypothetical protein